MAHVVVQLGVVAVDPQACREDGVLVPPVLVTSVRLQAVYQNQRGECRVQDTTTSTEKAEYIRQLQHFDVCLHLHIPVQKCEASEK